MDEIIGWLVVSFFNDHFPHPDDWEPDESDVLGNACCTVRCGPCHRLARATNVEKLEIERLVRLTNFQVGGWSYWNDESDSLRWDWLRLYWSAHRACGVSNGVLIDCEYDESSDEGDVISLHNGDVLKTHSVALCAGQFCCVHNPSDHPLRDAPLNWRADRQLMERVCRHGVGHTDPDDVAYKRRSFGDLLADTAAIHGCDGCCTATRHGDVVQ